MAAQQAGKMMEKQQKEEEKEADAAAKDAEDAENADPAEKQGKELAKALSLKCKPKGAADAASS